MASSDGQAACRFTNPLTPKRPRSVRQASLKSGSHTTETPQNNEDSASLHGLLPASYREGRDKDNIVATKNHEEEFLTEELNTDRLVSLLNLFWLVGRPMPPRPLHYQLLLSREIFITERLDQHLVWTTGRMFVKPLPRYLLEPSFWTKYLSCNPQCDCAASMTNRQSAGKSPYNRCKLRRRATGLLFTYTALISYESDFIIAKGKHLIPKELTFNNWITFVTQFLNSEDIYDDIDPRFIYGELRLSRLNLLLFFRKFSLRGYMSSWNQYSAFFQDNFAVLASATIYIAVVLTAMQVGLATKKLVDNDTFQSVSWGFTVASILGPLVFMGLVLILFLYFFVSNFWITLQYRNKRFGRIGVFKDLSKKPRT